MVECITYTFFKMLLACSFTELKAIFQIVVVAESLPFLLLILFTYRALFHLNFRCYCAAYSCINQHYLCESDGLIAAFLTSCIWHLQHSQGSEFCCCFFYCNSVMVATCPPPLLNHLTTWIPEQVRHDLGKIIHTVQVQQDRTLRHCHPCFCNSCWEQFTIVWV